MTKVVLLWWCLFCYTDIFQPPAEGLCHIVFTVSKQDAVLQASGTWTLYSRSCLSSSWFLVLSVFSGCQLAWWLSCLNRGIVGGPEPCLADPRPETFLQTSFISGSDSLSLSVYVSPSLSRCLSRSLSPGPCLCLNEEGNLPWIMNGDLYVLWCEHLSGSHYAPIRMDHGFRE